MVKRVSVVIEMDTGEKAERILVAKPGFQILATIETPVRTIHRDSFEVAEHEHTGETFISIKQVYG